MKNSKTTHLGRLDADHPIEISLYLRPKAALPDLHNHETLKSYKPLNHKEYADKHGADDQDILKVQKFASKYGLLVSKHHKGMRVVQLSGTVAQMEKAFKVELHRYQQGDKYYHSHSEKLATPRGLKNEVTGIFGLHTKPYARHYSHFHPNSSVPTSFSPLELAKIYNFPTGATGAGQCVAILELAGTYSPQDYSDYMSSLGITTPASVSVINVSGSSTPDTDADGEVMLDIEVAAAVAPGAKYVMYFGADASEQSYLDTVNYIIHDQQNKPSILSISWGAPEQGSSMEQQMNQAFQSAAVMGITVLVASGDNGSSDGASGINVDFPASSPYVTATGGTRLVQQSPGIQETVWNDAEGATGGGVSVVFAQPSWQKNAKVPLNPNNRTGRGVPDIAMVADPETGYIVRVGGQKQVIGGTSAVAPLIAGLIALISEKSGKKPGFLNPLLYSSAPTNPNLFRDITVGNNGHYFANKGWDACTGWGAINGTEYLKTIG